MRTYLIFGTNDGGDVWRSLGEVVAGGAQQALNKALDTEGYASYAAVPARNWNQGTPEVVQRKPVVKWASLPKGQMTVDEVLEDAEKEGLLEPVPEKEPEVERTRSIG